MTISGRLFKKCAVCFCNNIHTQLCNLHELTYAHMKVKLEINDLAVFIPMSQILSLSKSLSTFLNSLWCTHIIRHKASGVASNHNHNSNHLVHLQPPGNFRFLTCITQTHVLYIIIGGLIANSRKMNFCRN